MITNTKREKFDITRPVFACFLSVVRGTVCSRFIRFVSLFITRIVRIRLKKKTSFPFFSTNDNSVFAFHLFPLLLYAYCISPPQGLQLQERDGFRYYQYDWGVVGGPPTALSLEGIDDTMETPWHYFFLFSYLFRNRGQHALRQEKKSKKLDEQSDIYLGNLRRACTIILCVVYLRPWVVTCMFDQESHFSSGVLQLVSHREEGGAFKNMCHSSSIYPCMRRSATHGEGTPAKFCDPLSSLDAKARLSYISGRSHPKTALLK